MGYQPEQYFVSIEEPKIPFRKQVKGYITEVTVGLQKELLYLSKLVIQNVMP